MIELYTSEGPERVGFVLRGGEVIEVQNVSPAPAYSFDVAAEDLMRFERDAIASWHTHPGRAANLSSDDYEAFRMWPDLQHFIVGSDGIRSYTVTDQGEVLQDVTS
jgi:proteasome lid subunit RPN8/RPN11